MIPRLTKAPIAPYPEYAIAIGPIYLQTAKGCAVQTKINDQPTEHNCRSASRVGTNDFGLYNSTVRNTIRERWCACANFDTPKCLSYGGCVLLGL